MKVTVSGTDVRIDGNQWGYLSGSELRLVSGGKLATISGSDIRDSNGTKVAYISGSDIRKASGSVLISLSKAEDVVKGVSGPTLALVYVGAVLLSGATPAASSSGGTDAVAAAIASAAAALSVGPPVPTVADKPGDAVQAPIRLKFDASDVGKEFYYKATGELGGAITGTDIYTTGSYFPTVVIHAGVLKNKESGVVKVTVLDMTGKRYEASTRNGVTSVSDGNRPLGYRVSGVEA